jgi:uncharacterized protein YcfL
MMRKFMILSLLVVVGLMMVGCGPSDTLTQYEKDIISLNQAVEEILKLEDEVNDLGSVNELLGTQVVLSTDSRRSAIVDLLEVIRENRQINVAKITEIRELITEIKNLITNIRENEIELSEEDIQSLKENMESIKTYRQELLSERRENQRLLRVTRWNFRVRNVDKLEENLNQLIVIQNERTIVFDQVIQIFTETNLLLENYS